MQARHGTAVVLLHCVLTAGSISLAHDAAGQAWKPQKNVGS